MSSPISCSTSSATASTRSSASSRVGLRRRSAAGSLHCRRGWWFQRREAGVDGRGAGVDLLSGMRAMRSTRRARKRAEELRRGVGGTSSSKSGFELLGRPGEQDEDLAVVPSAADDGVEPLPGSTAVGVGQQVRRLRGPRPACGCWPAWPCGGRRSGPAEREHVSASVSRLRSSASATHSRVRSSSVGPRPPESMTMSARRSAIWMASTRCRAIVADDGLEGDGDAQIVEARGEVEGVGVLAMRCEHLGTDGDDFSNHSLEG